MPTQAFLVKWKHNGTIRPAHTLILGESFTDALRQHFHFNAVDAVETYEVVKPYFLNVRVNTLPYTFPITLYYTQHGAGKVYLKHYAAVLNNEVIFNALKDVSAEDHLSLNSLVKSFFNKVNSFCSDSDFNYT